MSILELASLRANLSVESVDYCVDSVSVTLQGSCQRSCCHGGVTLQLSHRKLCGLSHRKLGCLSHDRNKLDTPTADMFHYFVARFLYVAKRARPDLQVSVAFLYKRVKAPNIGDWKKLGRMVRYVCATIHISIILGSDGSGNMVWSIDASFAVHMDMKSHTRYSLTLGTGALISGSQS